jgi:transcriptional regulator GlxA family with amidase domain
MRSRPNRIKMLLGLPARNSRPQSPRAHHASGVTFKKSSASEHDPNATPGMLHGASNMRSVSMDRRVQKVAVLMQAGLHRSVPLHEFAKSVNLSESRLRHLFKIETGRSPCEFIKALRMERAKELCEATLLSIKEIMASVGMCDPSHFVRDFEKFYGLSPTRFRTAYGAKAFTENGAQQNGPIVSRLCRYIFVGLLVTAV